MAEEFKRMRQLVGTAADWATNPLVIGDGEIAFEREGGVVRAKLGDGASTFTQLPWFAESLWQGSGSYTFSRIDGPVVIGATTGPDRLSVRGGNFAAGIYREGVPTAGQHLGIIKFGALQGTAQPAHGALIRGEAVGNWSASNWGARLKFVVTPEGTIDDVSVATIEDDGGMVIGNPTGGSMGPGTLNVEALYVDGVQVIP